ncbi:Helix-turn-helix domain protein [Planctomycetes bacterium CA13]|uniref:Helix-turn-helix domain protein n=1 Tax=Novipirellula herctigrandis TaxID=2527986 RepID=A0A5C5Z0Y2_9BACT|nr:Helix-turn-helix domain protein [Planctomycetes bacterium CA13]
MKVFGNKIRELRKFKGYSLRTLAPMVGVGFSYLSKVENSKLDFGDSPSEALIHKLAETLDGDEDELLLMAGRIPKSIARRILEQPDVFRLLAKCDDTTLRSVAAQAIRTGKK